jgi:hypothetical protein
MLSSEPSAKSAVWSTCGYALLEPTARGWLKPTPAYWRLWLNRPELALVEESCAAEQKLHAALLEQPTRVVKPAELKALADTDVQHNYRHFLNLRDAVEAAGSLEAAYAGFFKAGAVQLPPLFLDLMVQAIACHLLQDTPDMWQWRAAEMLFRRQRVSVQDGRVLGGDSEVLDMNHETGGLGAIGRLLKENSTALPVVNLQVLNDANAARYQQSLAGAGRFNFLLDLTHEVQRELPHGLTLTMTRAQSGLKALAQVLEKWVQHFLGTEGADSARVPRGRCRLALARGARYRSHPTAQRSVRREGCVGRAPAPAYQPVPSALQGPAAHAPRCAGQAWCTWAWP